MLHTLFRQHACLWLWMLAASMAVSQVAVTTSANAQPTLEKSSRQAQACVVKIYGAGGLGGLEAYQSGFLVSPEGHVATTWSYVLDVEPIVVLDDGRRFESKIVGFEPTLELAVLKIEAGDVPYFRVDEDTTAQWGDFIIAVSNLFGIATGDEPASVMQGSVAAISSLSARRGIFKTPYQGDILVLDLVANNPGAAGGAVVDAKGQLIGMLGKELRDSGTGVWLNYALPAKTLRAAIGDIIAGRKTSVVDSSTPLLPRERSHNFDTLGMILIPDVLEKTPAYIDNVRDESSAARAELRPDDLVLLVRGKRIADQSSLREVLRTIDRRDAVEMTIQRGTDIIPVTLQP